MEAALLRIQRKAPSIKLATKEAQAVAHALQGLHDALCNALPLLQAVKDGSPGAGLVSSALGTTSGGHEPKNESNVVSALWLYQLCQTVSSELEPLQLAQAILDAASLDDEAQQQAALFDVLGASEAAIQILMQVAPELPQIRRIRSADVQQIASGEASVHTAAATPFVDIEEERRQFLLREAMDAAQVAAVAQAEVDALLGHETGRTTAGRSSSTASTVLTHTIARSSERQQVKFAEKAARRAAQALQRAKDAGAIVDDASLLTMDAAAWSASASHGGLLHRSPEELRQLQQSLLPEGSRQYYDDRGLPRGAIREEEGDLERVIIPPAQLDPSQLPRRLVIRDAIIDPVLCQAFEGTDSLNPMQSTTFDVAFHSRDNMMVCAPTGAGKTNVAMLTVTAHFRDVGLLGTASRDGQSGSMDTGKKVVYIAPMKALAQEVVEKFSAKLKPMRLVVRELTGDMQLTRAEADAANVIVTTPEKWDVVTRKSGTDENSLGNQCGLLIIDEVHLLADERGAVIESVVSRLHRLVESRQRQVRIVALSATLPNYDDVASFLQVPERGIFFFGPEYRPVPLQQTFIGVHVKSKDRNLKEKRMNEICFDVVLDSLQRGYQVMVFVHSRKGTGDTARALADLASEEGVLERNFMTNGKEGPNGEAHKRYSDRVKKSRNRELASHFENGCGIHHAGMLRGDRKLTEQMFNDGAIKVLCCTATLAWGINLPAHSVVIKGTEVYNPEKGGVVDLSILDVQQIFGRAGRPQFDSSGEATLITSNEAFPRYMNKLVRPVPIESNFVKQLADHLNAEVVGGTVTNLAEASSWLKYTYLYVRMMRNPLAYGISADQKADDPTLNRRCLELVQDAAKLLDSNRMLRFHPDSGNLGVAFSGRVAAHYYIQAESVATFNEMFDRSNYLSDSDLFRIICSAVEFRSMKLRPEEMEELQKLAGEVCPFKLKGAGDDDVGRSLITDAADKAFVLLQAYISRAKLKGFTLVSDMNYIASNAGRVARSLFEICLQGSKAEESTKLLRIAKSLDKQCWWFRTPLRHFEGEVSESTFSALETYFSGRGSDAFDDALSLLDMQPDEIGQLAHAKRDVGVKVQKFVRMLPTLHVTCNVKPITSSVAKFQVQMTVDFEWNPRWHGNAQSFWMWVEDAERNKIHHSEHVTISKRFCYEPTVLDFSVPLFSGSHFNIRTISESWVGVESFFPVRMQDIEIPREKATTTDLLDLSPLPTTALNDPNYEQLYSKYKTFNPIQTQLFHVLYHTDSPVLLGAPTGSGKTIVAEIALLRMKANHPKGICVYITPLKALARERLKEWQLRFGAAPLRWSVLELSGDTHHDQGALQQADVLVCTPEKWDLISRGWRGVTNERSYIFRVKLLVIDEIHLLGEERGAVLEAIVSRTRFIATYAEQQQGGDPLTSSPTRIIGLSTALANPVDLANWMGIDTDGSGPMSMRGLYNFRPSVRPVPTKVHLQGYQGKHYCPRMATMNKPCFAAIKELSPTKPTLIFVASRRQTRLTAFDIISYAARDEEPKMFLGCSDDYVEAIAERLDDEALRHTITFGIGLHHAGLSTSDRDTVEKMFLNGQIKVLVATATLAWGVNLPAHLVIVKGTEYFDGKTSRYVDYPLTDVLQMIGRAGRPGFDTTAVAVVMVVEEKKKFYQKFLYTPFPVESCFEHRINENLNAEIACETIKSLIDCVGYLTWTFFARRVKGNPSYYGAASSKVEDVEDRLAIVAKETMDRLRLSECVESNGDDDFSVIVPTVLGTAASQYYLTYRTPKQMQLGIREGRKIVMKALETDDTTVKPADSPEHCLRPLVRSIAVDEKSISWLLFTVCSTHEFDELPVRHNEEFLNQELSEIVMWGPDTSDVLAGHTGQRSHRNVEIFADPHTKGFLLVQAHLEHARLPISDYINDTKSVIENIPRLLGAMAFVAASERDVQGSFELLTQFSRTRQLFEARCKIDNPLRQLLGKDFDARRQTKGKSESSIGDISMLELRSMELQQATSMVQKLSQGTSRSLRHGSVNETVKVLFGFPLLRLVEASTTIQTDKTTGTSKGKLKIVVEIERTGSTKRNRDESLLTLTVLLGSFHQRFLFAHDTVRISRHGKWSIVKELEFDWARANADGGENGGRMVLRLLFDEIRGFDSEAMIRLK